MHDYDLVKYYVSLKDKKLNNPNVRFASVMRHLFLEYLSGEVSSAPEITTFTSENMPSKIITRFWLDKEKDKEAIEFLKSIKDRQINSFLKSLLRRSLDIDGLRCYYSEDYSADSELGRIKSRDRETKKKRRIKSAENELLQRINEDVLTSEDNTEKSQPIKPNVTKKTNDSDISPKKEPDISDTTVKEDQSSSFGGFDFFGAIGNINV